MNQEPVPVLDRQSWNSRAFFFDILALAALLLAGVALAVDAYIAGHFTGRGVIATGPPNFSVQIRIALEALVFFASFAWIAGRLLKASFRELSGSR